MSAEAWESELLAISGESASVLIRSLLDGAPDAMVVIDDRGRVLCFNLLAERMFGYSRDEVLGRSVELLVPERLRSVHRQHRALFARAPSSRPMDAGGELHGARKDGTEFSIEISLSPIRTAGALLTCASIRDISARLQREEQLRRTQARLLNAVESIQGACAIFDERDELVLCNSSFRLLFGAHTADALEGQRADELITRGAQAQLFRPPAGQTIPELIDAWLQVRHTPENSFALTTSESRDARELRVVERPTTDGGRLMTIWDVTTEVEHAQQLQKARALAEAASNAKSEFLASMSHELRTPLNAILGFAQLLQRDRKQPLSDRQQERVGHVLRSGEHLLRLIDDVLDLACIEAGRVAISLEPVGLQEILKEVQGTLEPIAAHSGISLTLAPLHACAPEVIADRTRLKQVLMNLGTNAIKYGRPGGRVDISAQPLEAGVRVCVQDDGIGIPSDQQSKIFQPFHRAGQETGAIEGTGIGLALSKRLAELMQANIGFSSEIGRGSLFWLDLRLPEAHDSRPAPALSQHAELQQLRGEGPRIRIVYIEDNPSNVAFMKDFFSDYGRVELLTAPSAEVGLPLILATLPELVLMDLNLPGMNGLLATKELASWPETRDIPVIALSAAALMRDGDAMRSAGFYRFLTKPVKLHALTQTLQELFGSSE